MWSDFFAAGGWGMYPTSLFGFLLIAASLLYALRPAQKKAGRIVLALGVVTFSAGLLGTAVGVCTSAHYIPQVAQADQLKILALGCEESLHDLVLALMLVILAGLIAAVGALRASMGARVGLTTPASTGD